MNTINNNKMNNILDLYGKNILITGASGGIGKQVALTVKSLGANVVITGRDIFKLKNTFNLLDKKDENDIYIIADLTNEQDINLLVDSCPMLDGIVHCAGTVDSYPTKYINMNKINETFSINYFSQLILMSSILRKKRININSSVVFLSSFSSQNPYSLGALYSGSKAALESYCKVLAVEHSSILRANCIAPALVKTDVFDKTFQDGFGKSKEDIEEYEKFYLHGFGETTYIANIASFLLSNASSWITGQTIVADGGYMLGLLSRFSK